MITQTYWNRLLQHVAQQRLDIEKLKALSTGAGTLDNQQLLVTATVITVNSGSPETYEVRVVSGAARTQTNWTINYIMSSDENTTFAEGDYVMVLLNSVAPHFIISGGGTGGAAGSGTYVVPTGWTVSGS